MRTIDTEDVLTTMQRIAFYIHIYICVCALFLLFGPDCCATITFSRMNKTKKKLNRFFFVEVKKSSSIFTFIIYFN